MRSLKFIAFVFAVLCAVLISGKSKKKEDPKQCEVCIANLETIDTFLTGEEKKDKDAIRKAIGKHCTSSGFGSEWKPNPKLNAKDVKMCYYFEPIKDSITTLYAMGMPKEKVCKRLMKDNPEICEVKYPVKVEKKPGEKIDYNKLRVKELKEILNNRGTKCVGCTEKLDFVKKCEETEHLDI